MFSCFSAAYFNFTSRSIHKLCLYIFFKNIVYLLHIMSHCLSLYLNSQFIWMISLINYDVAVIWSVRPVVYAANIIILVDDVFYSLTLSLLTKINFVLVVKICRQSILNSLDLQLIFILMYRFSLKQYKINFSYCFICALVIFICKSYLKG